MLELAGKRALEVFPDEAGRRYHEEDLGVIRTGRPLFNVEEEVMLPSGETVLELTSKVPLRNQQGEVTGVVGISRDITRHREAEEARLRSEQRFREILEHSRDIAYKYDLAARTFDYVSPSAEWLLGYSPEEFIAMGSKGLRELVHTDDRSGFDEFTRRLPEYMKGRGAAPACEYRLRHRSGRHLWFSDNASLLSGEDGRYAARIGTLRDITEAKRAQETLRESSRLEVASTLAGGIAHDFNNLMAAVLGNAEVLSLEFADDSNAVDMLGDITEAAEKAGHLAQQLLAFARGGKYQPRTLNLNDVITETLRLEQKSVPGHVKVQVVLSDELWQVKADASQMNQVLSNLLTNAIEAMPESGELRIETRNRTIPPDAAAEPGAQPQPGPYVELAMSDTGHGMPPPVLKRIFEPFFSTRFQGRGLGLAAVYGIVTNHDGFISVESESNQGASFRILLPAVDTISAGMEAPEEGLPVGTECILVVDDEPLLLTATRMILERLGYQTLTATNGREAVECVRRENGNIDLVLLDLAMPVMGGAEAFEQMRALHPDIEVILCSGYDIDPATQRLLDNGARSFLKKPFRMQILARELRRALDSRTKARKNRARKRGGKRKG